MTQQEILDYNKKCAEFMYPYAKAEYESGEISVDDGLFKKDIWVFGHYSLMKYHSDWNWIMEVIDKIEKLNLIFKITGSPTLSEKWYSYTVIIQQNKFTHISKDVYIVKYESDYSNNETKLEAVMQAINQFLISYNESKIR